MFNKKIYQYFPDVSGIYKITTLHNNLSYIGSALSLSKRMKDHRNLLRKGKCHVSRLQNIYNKYGEGDFIVTFLSIHNRRYTINSENHRELINEEEKWIKLLKPAYNTILTPTTQRNNPCKSRKVYQYTLKGVFVKEWESGREVLRQLGIQIQNGIKNASSGGFQWSYERLDILPEYKRTSGVKKKVKFGDAEFPSVTDLVEYLKGNRKTYQNITYAIRVGKKFRGKIVEFC